MLPTILSRTQQIYFQPLTTEEIYQAIERNFQIEDSKARIISTLANGSYSTALQYIENGFVDTRVEFIDIFRIVLKKKNYRIDFLNRIEKIIKEEDSKRIINGLLLFQSWLNDAYKLAFQPENQNIINTDQIDVLKNFCNNFPNYNFLIAFSKIENSLILIKKNVNIQIILVNLFLSLRQIIYKSS
jgi:DNA polymerase-3 subunit delta'